MRLMNTESDAWQKSVVSGRAVQGERRIITVLFCDVTGSTSMAGQMDPEDWAEIMNEAFAHLIQPIYRYEGTVARLMGDGLLAFFGAPFSHEDDPQRAVLAGLDIVEGIRTYGQNIKRTYGFDFDVRVGINTGPVVVGEIGTNQAFEYTAMGDAINVAARMEQTAVPGTVQISADTYRLVAPFFDFEALGELAIKGKSEPVPSYRVLGIKQNPGRVRGFEGLSTPLVGREGEMSKLREVVGGLLQGRGQIVCLIGDAGLGKSRLIEEVHEEWELLREDKQFQSLWSDDALVTWIEDRGVSYDVTRPYSIFLRRLQSTFEVYDTDSPAVARAKLETFFEDASTMFRDNFLRAAEAVLLLQSQADEPRLEGEALKHQLLEGLLSYARIAASRGPLIIVYDDLHWSDPASIDMIRYVFQLVDEVPVLILCAFRPYRNASSWTLKQAAETDYVHRYTEIMLQPLDQQATDDLMNGLLANAAIPQEIRELVLQKAEGNPFFVEEIVRELIQNGVLIRDLDVTQDKSQWRVGSEIGNITIPDTLQALLMARIDRLNPETKRTLQLAAVIGRTFYDRLLKTIVDHSDSATKHLIQLQRLEMIREAKRLPELEYMFRHELLRDAAYTSILRRERKDYHRRVAEAMVQLYPDRLEVEAHRLAFHYEMAGNSERALDYYQLAGDVAARLYANNEAADLYGRAIRMADKQDATAETLIYLYTSRGRALEFDGHFDKAIEAYQTLAAMGQEKHVPEFELASLIAQAAVYAAPTSLQDPPKAQKLLRKALPLAESLADFQAEAKIYWNLMIAENFGHGDMELAIGYGEKALALARQHDLKTEMAYTLHDLAAPLARVGRSEDALSVLAESRELWRELNNLPMLIDNLATAAYGYYLTGDMRKARDLAEQSIELSRKINSLWGQTYSLSTAAPVYLELGQYQQAIEAILEAIPLGEKANFRGRLVLNPLLLAWIYMHVGAKEKSVYWLDSALRTADETGDWEHYRTLMEVQKHLLNQDDDAASKVFAEAEKALGGAPIITGAAPIYHVLMFEFLLRTKAYDKLLSNVESVVTQMHDFGLHPFLADLTYLKGKALQALGRDQEALKVLYDARDEATRQPSRRILWEILAELGQIEASLGHEETASRLFTEAVEVIEYISDQIDDPMLKALFFRLPKVQVLLKG